MISDRIIVAQQGGNKVSTYQPTAQELENLKIVQRDYQVGHDILNRPFEELGYESVLMKEKQEHDHFNMIKPNKSSDPRQGWRSRDIKPLARQQLIEIAAQMTAQIMVPGIFAQNENDTRDKDAELIMKDLFDWNIENSDYEEKMLDIVFAFLTNRKCVAHVDYVKVMQQILQENEDGRLEKKEALDRILSGIRLHVVKTSELLITNAYEPDIQKQRAIIRRRLIDFTEAQDHYSDRPNWKHIKPGIKNVFHADSGFVYETTETEDRQYMVEEVIYYNRREDKQITYINGVEMEFSPIKHRDQKDKDGISRPKYPYAATYFTPTSNPRLYYGMSAVSEIAPQAEYVNKMHQIFTDTTYLASQPPLAKSGGSKFNKAVYMPGVMHNFSEETKITQLGPQANPQFALNAAREEERILKEAFNVGSLGEAAQTVPTAYQAALLREAALIRLGIMGKMLKKIVEQIGELYVDNIINHQTVAEVSEIVGDSVRLKYPEFTLPEAQSDGRTVARKISFSEDLIGMEMTDEEIEEEENQLAQDLDEDMEIIKVNPALFGQRRFTIRVSADAMIPRTAAQELLEKKEAYENMIVSPYLDKRKVTKDKLLGAYAPGQEDEYLLDETDTMMADTGITPGVPNPAGEVPAPQIPQGPELSNLQQLG